MKNLKISLPWSHPKANALANPAAYDPTISKFRKFPCLPFEIRAKIWYYALPSARALQLLPKPRSYLRRTIRLLPFTSSKREEYYVPPACHGGKQPTILSVCKESRSEALCHLTKLFGVYWNLEIDEAYFEVKEEYGPEAMLMTDMFRKGLLVHFKHFATDSMLWHWKEATATMEFKYMFQDKFDHFLTPVTILTELPNAKSCMCIRTDHTLQEDLVRVGNHWFLGPLSVEASLDEHYLNFETRFRSIVERELGTRDLMFDLARVYGRERKALPPGAPVRLDPYRHDWFG